MHKLEYFKTPIWSEEKPEFLKSLIKATDPYIAESKKRNKQIIKETNDFGFSHHSHYLMNDTKFKDFHGYVGQKALEFLDYQGFDTSQYQIFYEQSWVQEFAKNGGGHHSAHVHSNTHVNAFYFLKCGPETSVPVFHDPRTGARTIKLKMKSETTIFSETELVHFKTLPGDLIIFPGYLEHEFTVDHGKKPFRFIHVCLTAISKSMTKVNI